MNSGYVLVSMTNSGRDLRPAESQLRAEASPLELTCCDGDYEFWMLLDPRVRLKSTCPVYENLFGIVDTDQCFIA